jgi:hypothetical protein
MLGLASPIAVKKMMAADFNKTDGNLVKKALDLNWRISKHPEYTGSYTLSEEGKERLCATDLVEFEKRVEGEMVRRKTEQQKKLNGKKREEKRVAKALKAAHKITKSDKRFYAIGKLAGL